MSMDNYNRGKVLGKGSFGSAILVTSKKDNKNYVIKEIDISRMPPAEKESSKQEAQLLMALKHPNIVKCIECFTHANKLCIVMDWCSEGDLYGILQKRKGQQLSEELILDWLVQICLGLKHVHDRKILHRDIKSQNVFVSAGGLLKLGDFGVSKVLSNTWQLAATAVGTPYYLSPEICQNKKYNQKSDIWSLGCLLYEMSTMRHAFEAPNMRALIQKIIKGQYTPLPSTRSKDLRDLVDRMLTLDWQKRPTINDILATPFMKARIQKFLTTTLQAHEFSHTIIHGRPKPGDLVVQAPPPPSSANLPPVAFPEQMAAAQKAMAAPGSKPAAAAVPAPGVGSAAAAAAAAGSPVRPTPSAAAHKVPSPSAARPSSGMQRASPPGVGAVNRAPIPSAANRASPPSAAARPASGAAAAAAQQKAAAANKEVDTLVAKRKEEEVRRARENAAVAAQREVERMKLDEQRRKLEQERARTDAERKAVEAKRADEYKRAKAEEEAARKLRADHEKRDREDAARRRKMEEDAKKKEAERFGREKERADMHAKIAAQKQEYMDRQAAAQRNRAAAEDRVTAGGKPVVVVAASALPPPRKQWQNVEVPEQGRGAGAAPVREAEYVEERNNGRKGAEDLTPEQRRAVWEEMQEGKRRNQHQAGVGGAGGLAAFLGVPEQEDGRGGRAGGGHGREAAAGVGASRPLSSEEARRKVWEENKAAAEQNRRQVEGDRYSPPPQQRASSPYGGGRGRDGDYYERKKAKLEEERLAREAEIREFQRAHYHEMREAAERNRRQIMSDIGAEKKVGGGGHAGAAAADPGTANGQRQQSPPAHNGRNPSPQQQNDEGEDDGEFAAMVKDMQDVLLQDNNKVSKSAAVGGPRQGTSSSRPSSSQQQHSRAGVSAAHHNGHVEGGGGGGRHMPAVVEGDDDDDDDEDDYMPPEVRNGRFMLNGQPVKLGAVKDTDPLGIKVEALKVYLEKALGSGPFLKVYRRLESLSVDDDEGEVSREFLAVLGEEKLPFLALVHQLIVCEEQWAQMSHN